MTNKNMSLLDPEARERVERALAAWEFQMHARGFRHDTTRRALKTITVLIRDSGKLPWELTEADLLRWGAHLTVVRALRGATVRSSLLIAIRFLRFLATNKHLAERLGISTEQLTSMRRFAVDRRKGSFGYKYSASTKAYHHGSSSKTREAIKAAMARGWRDD